MKYICNPLNLEYKYQILKTAKNETLVIRESADPSIIRFKGQYYLFPSMCAGFWTSDDLIDWQYHKYIGVDPYDYAPDVCVIGGYIYYSASKRTENIIYRSDDPINKGFTKVTDTFQFWDPHMFQDDDKRVYFYWGCTNNKPLFGVELSSDTMKEIGEVKELVFGNDTEHGFERIGENHILKEPITEEEKLVRQYVGTAPFIEGAWMTKHNGKYYLQYGAPGTQYNIYADGVYVGDSPLGPFTYAKNNPYSYKPGGFCPGAGHGSTFYDKFGNLWHTSTMRISMGYKFERRLGLFPAGFDNDGELFCNQRYGDWPMLIPQKKFDPWQEPNSYLLSYGKKVTASSVMTGYNAQNAVDENIRIWWKANSNNPGEWLEVDLGKEFDVSAVQINFADDNVNIKLPSDEEFVNENPYSKRYIDQSSYKTRWKLEGSLDGKTYFILKDKSTADTDFAHDLVIIPENKKLRYVKCTILELPHNQIPAISGLRIFGKGGGKKPDAPQAVRAERISDLDMDVEWQSTGALGFNVLWGHTPDKLYHSYMVFGKTEQKIGALNKGQNCYVRVDAFNENGITQGKVTEVR